MNQSAGPGGTPARPGKAALPQRADDIVEGWWEDHFPGSPVANRLEVTARRDGRMHIALSEYRQRAGTEHLGEGAFSKVYWRDWGGSALCPWNGQAASRYCTGISCLSMM